MRPFHFNLGLYYEGPFESRYARYRRFLFANPGIPKGVLEGELRRQVPGGANVDARLLYLQRRNPQYMPTFQTSKSHTRQCPECAKLLYHTDLFNLPWITHCPIHHCKLTEHCPACHETWPDRQGIAKRNCPSCGLGLERANPNLRKDWSLNNSYAPIKQLYDFINYKQGCSVLLGWDDAWHQWHITKEWWQEYSIESPFFPGCQIQRTSYLDANDLKQYHVHIIKMQKRIADLKEYEASAKTEKYKINEISLRHHRSLYKVLKMILQCIDAHTEKKHNIFIGDYSYYGPDEMVNGPTPCSFCTALNIWVLYVIASMLGKHGIHESGQLFLCRDSRFLPLPDMLEINTVQDAHGNRYYVDNKFSIWHFERGLQILFLQLYFLIEFLKIRLFTSEYSSPVTYYQVNNYIQEHVPDLFYLADIKDRKMHYYYRNSNPIAKSEFNYYPHAYKICRDHRKHLHKCVYGLFFIDKTISSDRFDYSDYLSLFHEMSTFVRSCE